MLRVSEKTPSEEKKPQPMTKGLQLRVPNDHELFRLFFKTDKVFRDRAVAVLYCYHKNAENLSKLPKNIIKLILFLIVKELAVPELKALDEIKKHSKSLDYSEEEMSGLFEEQFGDSQIEQLYEMAKYYQEMPTTLLKRKAFHDTMTSVFMGLDLALKTHEPFKKEIESRSYWRLIPKTLFESCQNVKKITLGGSPVCSIPLHLAQLKQLESFSCLGDFLPKVVQNVFLACESLKVLRFIPYDYDSNPDWIKCLSTLDEIKSFVGEMKCLESLSLPAYWVSEFKEGIYGGFQYLANGTILEITKLKA